MSIARKKWAFVIVVAGLAMAVAALGPKLAGPVLGQSTTVSVVSPGTASVGDTVTVTINIDDVANLGVYEWQLAYNSNVLELAGGQNPVNGPFLGSTGRTVACAPRILGDGTVRFGCGTVGDVALLRPSGSGLLSTVTFTATASGSSSLCLKWASLGDSNGDDIPLGPSQYQHAAIAVGGGSAPPPSCPPAATPTPYVAPTATPGGEPPLVLTPYPTATSGPAAPTATPAPPAATATPTGPTPTPAPTPPPENADVIELFAGCNPMTTTYPDGTTVQTLTSATSAGVLNAIWKFDVGVWRAYSPEFPQVSDLATTDFLDVVFLCAEDPGTFVRPRVL